MSPPTVSILLAAALTEPTGAQPGGESLAASAPEVRESPPGGDFDGFTTPDPGREPVPAPAEASASPAEPLVEPLKDEPDEARPPSWRVGAFVDTAYLFSSNLPGNHLYVGQITHPRTGEITLNVAAAHLTHTATDREPWRFELAVHAGAAVDALYAGEPVPGGNAGAFAGREVWKHVALANGGYRFKRGTEIDVGLMSAPIGFGGFWSRDNWTFSPALASNAAPYYLMGARVAQALGAGVSVEAWIVNGWQTIADVNRVPSGLVGLHWEGGDTTVIGQVYFGPEQPEPSAERWLVHGDTQVIWDAHPVGVAVVVDAGREGWSSGRVDDPIWVGGGVWVRGDLWQGPHASLVLAGRPEAWWDRGGRIFGIPQLLLSGTIGPSLYVRDLFQVRLEYRYDHSLGSDGYFGRGDALALAVDQHTLMLNLLAKFEHVFARRAPG